MSQRRPLLYCGSHVPTQRVPRLDQEGCQNSLLYEVVVIYRGAPGVSQITLGGPKYLHCYGRSLVGPDASEKCL